MEKETQELLLDIKERVVRIETKLEDFGDTKRKADDAYNMSVSNKGDIEEMKDGQKWLWRTVGGGFIAGVIAFIFKWGGKS